MLLTRDYARGRAAMNRIKDYSGFVGWFAGLGYIVLWPITVDNLSGEPFGASIFCRDGPISVPDILCNSAHPLRMPLGLHALGFMSAMFVTVRLLIIAIRRTRRKAGARASTAPPIERISAILPPQPPRKPARLRHCVKPRKEFGLRGMTRPEPILQKDDA
jgi:hypothetical protein